MSNIIPPLLSSSPPPMVGVLDEEEDDEFGDFAVATNLSYGCDALSSPSLPQKSPMKSRNQSSPIHCYDTNSSEITDISASKGVEKDFQDKRKNSVTNSERISSASESNIGQENHSESNVNSLLYNNGKIKPKTDSKYNTFQYFPEIPPDIVPDDEDEFGDVGNGYVEKFDEFQDFEMSTNIANDSEKLTIPEETDIPNVNNTINANSELTEQVLNECKPRNKHVEPEDEHTKCDGTSKNNDTCTKVEENLDVTKQVTDPINTETFAVSDGMTKCIEVPLKAENNSTILTNNLQEPTNHETVVDSPIQVFEQTNENETCKSANSVDSFKNATSSESEDNLSAAEEPAIDEFDKASSESEDPFGDFENHSFEPHIQDATEPSQPINRDQIPDLPSVNLVTQELDETSSVDDFGDFETSLPEPKLQWDSNPFNTKSTDLDTNNFGDFDNQVFELDQSQDFADFDDAQVNTASKSETLDNEDDFGDFNDCSGQAETSQGSSGEVVEDARQLQRVLSVDVEAVPQRAQAIILDMFPVIKQSAEDFCEEDFTSSDTIFSGLGDVTDTCALLYQWSKSNSQNCFLRALNIDTRNILYGPRWNESMPRYAATLGYTPLEPVKSEILAPTTSEPSTATAVISSQPPSSEAVPQTEIPSAQFDWVGSGLTNPLENSPASTMLLDLEQLVASLDIQFSSTLTPKSPNSPSPVNDIDDWEFWLRLTPKKVIEKRDPLRKESKNLEQSILQTDILRKTSQEMDTKPVDFEFSSVLQPEVNMVLQAHSDSGSVKSLQFNEIQPEEVVNKTESNTPEFDDFTSFQSSSKSEESSNFPTWSFNAVPLRETHISNLQSEPPFTKPDKTGINFDEPGWLKPTILTPDLPRKVNVPEEPQEEEEEFADFQTSVPEVISETIPVKLEVENIEPVIKSDPCDNASSLSNIEDDDEFTDFQSTLPNSLNPPVLPTPVPQEPLQPAILEPLKPSLLQPMTTAAINWPDPGLTDDDLIRIELNYKPKSLNSDSETPEVDAEKISESSSSTQTNQERVKAVDDDDWSDFVSSQGPPAPVTVHNTQPAFKTSQFKPPSRTSTPELSLCIPQLNQIQPPRRPVPVITQQGLIQTKLPIEPVAHPSVQTKTYPQVSQLQNGFQPSLISSQFAAQFGQGLGYHNIHQNRPPQATDVPKQNKGINNLQQDLCISSKSSQYFLSCQTSKSPAPQVASSKADEFDDEWTDFVSSQPAPPVGQAVIPIAVPNGLHGHPQPKINFDWNRPPQFTSWSANVTPNIITNPVSFDSFQSYSSPAQTDLLKNRTGNRKNPNVVMQPKKNTIPSISSVPDLEFIAPKSRTWKK